MIPKHLLEELGVLPAGPEVPIETPSPPDAPVHQSANDRVGDVTEVPPPAPSALGAGQDAEEQPGGGSDGRPTWGDDPLRDDAVANLDGRGVLHNAVDHARRSGGVIEGVGEVGGDDDHTSVEARLTAIGASSFDAPLDLSEAEREDLLPSLRAWVLHLAKEAGYPPYQRPDGGTVQGWRSWPRFVDEALFDEVHGALRYLRLWWTRCLVERGRK